MKTFNLTSCLLLLFYFANAQNTTITGNLYNAQTGAPLSNYSVTSSVAGTVPVTTNASGAYTLVVPSVSDFSVIVIAQFGTCYRDKWTWSRKIIDFYLQACNYNTSRDSIALRSLYDNLNGASWTSPWNINQPITTWGLIYYSAGSGGPVKFVGLDNRNLNGVFPTSATGFANLLDLFGLDFSNNANLRGSLPSLTNMKELDWIKIQNTSISGNPLSSITGLKNIEMLSLRNNTNMAVVLPASLSSDWRNVYKLQLEGVNLSGTIPATLFSLTNVQTLGLGQNKLTGTVPTLPSGNASNIQYLVLNDNRLDSLPNLSSSTTLTALGVKGNKLTFDDIIPNISKFNTSTAYESTTNVFTYAPQDSIFVDTVINKSIGDPLSINLGIDAGIASNTYNWYKNGIFYTSITGSNTLSFNSLVSTDAGVYTCQVKNTIAPLLVLQSRNVTITIGCAVNPPTVGAITQPTCLTPTGSVILNGLPATGTWILTRFPDLVASTGTGTSTTITGLAGGTYTYIVKNAAGCASTASANIVINAAPTAPTPPSVGTITHPTCSVSTGNVVLNGLPATGAWTLTQSPGGVTTLGTGTSKPLFGLAAGTYTFTVTNAAGCTSLASANVVINAVPTAPNAPSVGAIIQPTCTMPTGSVTLSNLPASGTWTLKDIISGIEKTGSGTSTVFTGLTTGTHAFQVTNAAGCISPNSTNITINAVPTTPTITLAVNSPTCGQSNGSINSTITGGTPPYSYSWSTGATTANINNISAATTTNYTFTATDAAGCSAFSSAQVTCTAATCRQLDSLQLVALFNATNGTNWLNKTNWLTTNPINTWFGITVNTEGCVTEIRLGKDSLRGTLPNLSIPALVHLDLNGNQINGTISNFNLPNLQYLILGYNKFEGSIPNFNLPSLTYLDLGSNLLSGTIPDFNLPNLKELALFENKLTGRIPNFNLPNLTILRLAINQLDGSIPNFNLPNLIHLGLGFNQLTGAIPNFNLPNLTILDLSFNLLSDIIPNFNLPNLTRLQLNHNKLSGSIPNFNLLHSLIELYLGQNELNQSIPNFNLPNLVSLWLYDNQLSGTIPNFNLPNLFTLLLQNNQLNGCIPRGIKTQCPLITSAISNNFTAGGNISGNNMLSTQNWTNYWNNFEGACPIQDTTTCRYKDSLQLVALFNATNGARWLNKTNWLTTNPINTWFGITVNTEGCVTEIRLGKDSLSGTLPNLNIPSLFLLDLSSNQISGTVPNLQLPNLQILVLGNNKLNNTIPYFSLPKLQDLFLNNNRLTGSVPNFTQADFPNLRYLDLSFNFLNGSIPNFNLTKLGDLRLNGNLLTGNIPNFNIQPMFFLLLNGNQLTGNIPNFNLPNLQVLNINDNKLSGELPSFQNLNKIKQLYLQNNNFSGCYPTEWQKFCRLQYNPNYVYVDSAYNIIGNPKLAWQGDFQRFCNSEPQIGASCNDSLATTINDKIQADCSCKGTILVDTTACRYKDSIQLVALFNATNGANWRIKTNWLTTNPINTWYGITVNTEGCVTEIRLINDSLRGTIPNLNIPNLQNLYLSSNQLSGNIPNFTLPNLQNLYLNSNQLSSIIPNFTLPNLKDLYLYSNQLTGNIPNFTLPNLQSLYLYSNQLTGNIPNFTLPNLQGLVLFSNQLTGTIPNFTLPNLQYLILNSNQLSGIIPNFTLPNLQSLSLHSNQLSGTIPNFTLPNLTYLRLENNLLNGCIPQGIKTNCPLIGSTIATDAAPTGGNISSNPLLSTQVWANYWNNSTGACLACTSVTSSISGTTNICSTDSTTLTAVTNAVSPTYLWSNGATMPSITTATAGTYTVTISQSDGCSKTGTTTVTRNAPSVTNTIPSNRCGTGTVSLSATASAGTLNWFAASTGGTGLGTGTSFTTPSISTSTTYYVEATNNGCASTRTPVVATINQLPSITNTIPSNRCGTGTVSLSATASAGTLNWFATSTGGTSLGTGTSFTTPSISISTTYYVEAANSSCTSTRTPVVATINQSPSATLTPVSPACGQSNGSISASVTGGKTPYTYLWSNNATSATINNISANTPTNYVFTATDANSCTVSQSIQISCNCTSASTPSVTASQTAYCGTQSTTLTITNGTLNNSTNWQWYSSTCGGTAVGSGTSITVSPVTTTTYFVRGEGGCANGNCASVTITVNPSPTIVPPSVTHVKCKGGSDGRIVLSAIGGSGIINLSISPSVGNQPITGTFASLTAQKYTFTATDNNGCSATRTVDVTEPAAVLSLGNPVVTNVKCNGASDGRITAVAVGGTGVIRYAITPNFGTQTPTGVFNNLKAQTYTITATDANLCTDSKTINITEPTPFTTAITKTDASLCFTTSGSAEATAAGGLAPYTYLWSNNARTQSINNLTLGTYSVSITDAAGCTQNAMTTIVALTDSLAAPSVSATNIGVDSIVFTWTAVPNASRYEVQVKRGSWIAANGNLSHTVTGLKEYEKVEFAVRGISSVPKCGAKMTIIDERTKKEACTNDLVNIIPDGFTPGNNGANDYFDPEKYIGIGGCSNNVKAKELYIYNRWGEVVFKGNPYTQWDGRSLQQQKIVASATYFYVFVVEVDGVRKSLKGVLNVFAD